MTNRHKNKTKAQNITPNGSNISGNAKSMAIGPNDAAPWSTTSYISTVCVHTTLWVFVALYLPRSISLINLENSEWDRVQVSSRDRPQHPFLEALTAHPTWTLFSICLGGTILQSWWAGWTRDWWLKLGIRGTSDEKRMERALHTGQKFNAFLNSYGATFASSFLFHLILILFGAPISSHILKTYLLALLVSIMTVYPPSYTVGVPTLGNNSVSVFKRWTWVRMFTELSTRNPVERALVYPAVGTLLGCWIGIVPIALDWDRPWQAWPLTPAFGAVGGYILSSMVALTVNVFEQLAQEQSRARRDVTERKVQ
ncbi:hypothetical protein M413DRAFT_445279 [Hebeloma cylindrosporum]|uniref:GPI biosynthesis protein Pig-F n=1 Tax=Hebeloma cylindrosporum TaxID=76867 RepID=A0A0C3CCB3_HEBCY|nr:hypothetical protein M413DRAFT_445279 [Hebeloma cylindrosporum h7]